MEEMYAYTRMQTQPWSSCFRYSYCENNLDGSPENMRHRGANINPTLGQCLMVRSLTIITFYRLEVVSRYSDPQFKLAESCLV